MSVRETDTGTGLPEKRTLARGVLRSVGGALREMGWRRAFLVAGNQAFAATSAPLLSGLRDAEVLPEVELVSGVARAEDVTKMAFAANAFGADGVLGVGGGGALDMAKAVAGQLLLPVVCAPTVAATCAAATPFSALHGEGGRAPEVRRHAKPVQAVFVDMDVIAAAPARYLAAGMAIAFAAAETAESERLTETLFRCGERAYEDAIAHIVTDALTEAVSCVVFEAGAWLSGALKQGAAKPCLVWAVGQAARERSGGGQTSWLCGEMAAVGVLAQQAFRGCPQVEAARAFAFLRDIGLPTSLRELTLSDAPREMEAFIRAVCLAANVSEADASRAGDALRGVR